MPSKEKQRVFPLLHCLLSLSADQGAFILQSLQPAWLQRLLDLLAGSLLFKSRQVRISPDKSRRVKALKDRLKTVPSGRERLDQLSRTIDPLALQRKLAQPGGQHWAQVIKLSIPYLLRETLHHETGKLGRGL